MTSSTSDSWHRLRHLSLCCTVLTLLSACGDCGNTGTGPINPGRDQGKVDPMDQGSDLGPGDMLTDAGDKNDQGGLDLGPDSGDSGRDAGTDLGRMDMNTDLGRMDMADMPGGEDMDPGVSTCPVDLRNSCLYEALSCFGSNADVDSCFNDPLLGQREVNFRNGSQAIYRERPTANGLRQEFRTLSPSGQMCYLGIAQEDADMPMTWEFRDGATMFKHFISFSENEVRVTCASGEVEVCSRAKFDLYFAWPNTPPTQCPDKDPNDLCDADVDCASGQQCCRLGDASSPKQCATDDICIVTRTPDACDVDGDCSANEVCRRCDRAGRECVPLGFDSDPMNSLSCEPDQCDPNMAGACSEPRTCCITGGSFTCVIPSECDMPPDPNPLCQVNDSQPCINPTQSCCYVSQLNDFRCIDQNASCRTNVCFGDADCGGNQECCNANPVAGTPGSCLGQCQNEDITCTGDSDCATAGAGAFCCQFPGYTVGTCELIPENCRIVTCEMSPTQCDAGNVCCNAAPLSTPTCITTGSVCPPEP